MPEKIIAAGHNTTIAAGTLAGGSVYFAWGFGFSMAEWLAIGTFFIALISAFVTNFTNIWYKRHLLEIERKKNGL